MVDLAFHRGSTWRCGSSLWIVSGPRTQGTPGSPQGPSNEVSVVLEPEPTDEASRGAPSSPDSPIALTINGDQLLLAARCGWGVTLRLLILRVADRWPALFLGGVTGSSLGLVHSYAQAHGWL